MNTTYTATGKTTTREWTINSEHIVTVVTKTENGYFAQVASSRTSYSCSCGKSTSHAGPAIKAHLEGHDAWKTEAERKELLASLGL